MAIQSLAVFCGSKPGANPLFLQQAKDLGYRLAAHDVTLIYGGSKKGMMGAIADAVLEKKGKVIGVMPRVLSGIEHSHGGLSEMHETDDMHARKKMIYDKADAAMVLPGGYGTMDELFEMLTWNQLSIHDKKIYILNTAGFYNCLLAQLKIMEQENFLHRNMSEFLTILQAPEELLFH